MTDLLLIVIFYILPMLYFFKVAYEEEDGAFIAIALVPALSLACLLIVTLLYLVVNDEKLIKRIKYGKDRNNWSRKLPKYSEITLESL